MKYYLLSFLAILYIGFIASCKADLTSMEDLSSEVKQEQATSSQKIGQGPREIKCTGTCEGYDLNEPSGPYWWIECHMTMFNNLYQCKCWYDVTESKCKIEVSGAQLTNNEKTELFAEFNSMAPIIHPYISSKYNSADYALTSVEVEEHNSSKTFAIKYKVLETGETGSILAKLPFDSNGNAGDPIVVDCINRCKLTDNKPANCYEAVDIKTENIECTCEGCSMVIVSDQ